jgi:hypothetical protein
MYLARTVLVFSCVFFAVGLTQDSAASTPPTPVCTIHIFPRSITAVTDATSTGRMSGVIGNAIKDTVQGLFKVRNTAELTTLLAQSLPLSSDIEIIKSQNLSSLTGFNRFNIVIHDAPELSKNVTARNFKSQARLIGDETDCYHELIFSGTYYVRTTLSKELVATYFIRSFNGSSQPTRARFSSASKGLKEFPPDFGTDTKGAEAELRTLNRINLLEVLQKFKLK